MLHFGKAIAVLLISGAPLVGALVVEGFQSGNDFQSVDHFGTFTLQCNDPIHGTGFAVETCYENRLYPTDEDYLVSDSPMNAKHVVLNAQHEDGSTASQQARYFAAKQRSRDQFKLWPSSELPGSPLLETGINIMSSQYLSPTGQVLASGAFVANVSTAAPRTCNNRTLTSNSISDCNGGGQRLCKQYFEEENYCQY